MKILRPAPNIIHIHIYFDIATRFISTWIFLIYNEVSKDTRKSATIENKMDGPENTSTVFLATETWNCRKKAKFSSETQGVNDLILDDRRRLIFLG
jgi:hypothetical protein